MSRFRDLTPEGGDRKPSEEDEAESVISELHGTVYPSHEQIILGAIKRFETIERDRALSEEEETELQYWRDQLDKDYGGGEGQ